MMLTRMAFLHGLVEAWVETLTRAVGPTTAVGKRGTLPQPAPTDVNSIWLAPNGNDANAGTQALPKLTPNGAVTALGGAKTNVQIFRNGYVGPLEFTHNAFTLGTLTLATHSIQVEEGETARITFNPTGTVTDCIRLSNASKANGIYFDLNTTASVGRIGTLGVNAGVANEFQNCHFDTGTINAAPIVSTSGGAANDIATHCVTKSLLRMDLQPGDDLSNSIIMFNSPPIGGTVANSLGSAVGWANTTGQTETVNRCIFVGWYRMVTPTPTAALGTQNTYVFNNCHLINVRSIAEWDTGAGDFFALTLDHCLSSTMNIWENFAGTINGSPSVTFNETGAIPPTTPPLFRDESLGRTGDASGFRLQRRGASTGMGGKYYVTSPLVGAGIASVDINPWDESVTGPTYTFSKTTELYWAPAGHKRIWRYTNQQTQYDIRGNLHTAYDSRRREFEFDYGGKYANNLDLYKIVKLAADTGTMKFFPRGIGVNLFVSPSACDAAPLATTGIFATADSSFSPIFDIPTTMVENHWAGMWITINVGGTEKDYYIVSNTTTKFILSDRFSVGLPSNATYPFEIRYLLVKAIPQDVEAIQEYFSAFIYGGSFAEPSGPAATAAYELSGFTAKFTEVEDLEEAS